MTNNLKKGRPIKVNEQGELYPEWERFEIIEGLRYDLSPAPTINHQQLVGNLYISLRTTCHPNGVILLSPIDVYLDEENLFQPDLIFIKNENTNIIKEKRIEGAPDLVVEILSPSTSVNDKIRKKAQYERFGVNEYWIVDPVHLFVDQFVLQNGVYSLQATYANEDIIHSDHISCIAIEVEKLFNVIKRK